MRSLFAILKAALLVSLFSLVACNGGGQTPPGILIVGKPSESVPVTTSPLTLIAHTPGIASGSVEFFEGTKSLGTKTETTPTDKPEYTLVIPITKSDNGKHSYTAVIIGTGTDGVAKTYTSLPFVVTISL